MKNCMLFFTVIALTFAGTISYAQNSILAGKIVDENNKPMPGAEISISRYGQPVQEMQADGDGLYCSKLLGEGTYHVAIMTDGKRLESKKLLFDVTPEQQKYYIIKVLGNRIAVDKVDKDPSLAVKLTRIENDDHNTIIIDGINEGIYRIHIDTTTGKVKSVQAPAEGPPPMK